MHWDAVAIAVRDKTLKYDVTREMKFLIDLGFFTIDELLIVDDACHNVGSAGCALNALLITAERLCAKAKHSVLNETVLHENSVLILLIGEAGPYKTHGAAFLPMTPPTSWKTMPDTVLVRHFENLKALKADEKKGVWICGTDSCFSLKSLETAPILSDQNISVFSFHTESQIQEKHGTYVLDEKGALKSIQYPSPRTPSAPLVVPLLFFPPTAAAAFLALHATDPLSATTYYGEDTGTLGLRLSIFFDILLATCLSLEEFLDNDIGKPKIDLHSKLRRNARRVVWQKLHKISTDVVMVPGTDFKYLANDEAARLQNPHGFEISEQRTQWEATLIAAVAVPHTKTPFPMAILNLLVTIESSFCNTTYNLLFVLSHVSKTKPSVASRNFFVASEYMSKLAGGLGGLRIGPAANPAFAADFSKLRDPKTVKDGIVNVFTELSKWTRDPAKLTRGARHAEAAGQILYGAKVCAMRPKWKHGKNGVTVKAAARVDIFGGWLDTPPITFETSPASVINMAITLDDELPLTCTVRPSTTRGLTYTAEGRTTVFTSYSEIQKAASHPNSHGSLVCACVFTLLNIPDDERETVSLEQTSEDIYGTKGIEVSCSSTLPHGSGLGTSSILAACILTALRGEHFEKQDLVHFVLYVEQVLTTGGGWQDQIGGIYPGVKIGSYKSRDQGSIVSRVVTEQISISPEFEQEINERLVLIYTGKTRLAKNLLQEVVRNWYVGTEVVELLKRMQQNLDECKKMIESGEFPIDLVELYYDTKKGLAPGCEPPQVRKLIEDLKAADLSSAAWIAGAGGGGFLYNWLPKGKKIEDVGAFLEGTTMTAHKISISHEPMTLEVIE